VTFPGSVDGRGNDRGVYTSVVQAQIVNPKDQAPPKPIEELAAEFARDPGYSVLCGISGLCKKKASGGATSSACF
jgi:hypothetical protein